MGSAYQKHEMGFAEKERCPRCGYAVNIVP
jgi:hypothetical protein